MPPTDTPADNDVDRGTDHSVERETDDEITVVENVAAAATGMVIAKAALWFLAPICFTC